MHNLKLPPNLKQPPMLKSLSYPDYKCNILHGMNWITVLKCVCFNKWHNIDDYHEKWYKEAILIAGKKKENKTFFKANKPRNQLVLQVNIMKGHLQFL